MKMFDRKAYGQRYSREKRERRKAEGRCVTCGVKLTFECTTLQCEQCREKQKFRNVAKVNISKLIAEAKAETKADTVRKMQERLKAHFDSDSDYFRSSHGYIRSVVDQTAKEVVEET
jgi:hypothetical protein